MENIDSHSSHETRSRGPVNMGLIESMLVNEIAHQPLESGPLRPQSIEEANDPTLREKSLKNQQARKEEEGLPKFADRMRGAAAIMGAVEPGLVDEVAEELAGNSSAEETPKNPEIRADAYSQKAI